MPTDRPDGSPTAVDVILRPEWAAKEGTDKSFLASGENKTGGERVGNVYLVPAGKTLYIVGVSFDIHAYAAANYDHHYYGQLVLANQIDTPTPLADEYIVTLGGLGGGGLVLTKPVVIPAGRYMGLHITNRANLGADMYATAWGYEV